MKRFRPWPGVFGLGVCFLPAFVLAFLLGERGAGAANAPIARTALATATGSVARQDRARPGQHPALHVLHSFSGTDGALPGAAVLVGVGGALFGTTEAGGVKNLGTAYELAPSGSGYVETILHSFVGGALDGAEPVAPVVADASGNLYGTTPGGGVQLAARHCAHSQYAQGCGILFTLTPSASGYTERTMYRFMGGRGGRLPYGALVVAGSGTLEGTTMWGGAGGYGTVFNLTSGKADIMYSFAAAAGGAATFPDGALPAGAVALSGNGTFYGTAPFGGTTNCLLNPGTNCGVVYGLAPAGSKYDYSTLHSFGGGSDGAYPQGGVVMDAQGALYGTTELGGTANLGTVFKLTPGSSGAYVETVIHAFQGGDDGALPLATVVVDEKGVLYGTTSSGGDANAGTIFKLTPSGSGYTERVVYAFTGGSDGAQPVAALALDKAGVLYGTALGGGAYAAGTVFALQQ